MKWIVGERLTILADDFTGKVAAVLANDLNSPTAEETARANLIAAAPDMLEHVKRFAATLEYYIRRDQNDGDAEGATLKGLTLATVRETIAKAEGR